MSLISFAAYGPDRSPFDAAYSDTMQNVMPLANGYGPFPSFSALSQALPSRPMGYCLAYVTNGSYKIFAGTATGLFLFNATTLGWTPVSKKGADQATNGTFAVDANWTKGDASITISAGVAHFTATPDAKTLSQSQALTVGTIYKLTYTISSWSAGAIKPEFTGGTPVVGTSRAANGTYTEYFTAVTGNNTLAFLSVGATTANIDNVILEPLTVYATSVMWSMTQFGSSVIAVNNNDTPQIFDVNTSTEFIDITGSPPKSQLVGSLGDFVMMAHLSTDQRGIQWSGLNNPNFWTPRQRSSDFQSFPSGGEIISYVSNPGGCLILSATEIHEGRLALETPMVMTFQQTVNDHGCVGPRAAVSTGAGVFYLSQDGFYMYGNPPARIGDELVDNTFLADIQRSELYNVWATEDPNRKIVYFAYRSLANNVANSYDKVLLFHYGLGKWSILKLDQIMTGLISATTPGYTLDGLDALGLGVDSLPYSLDSRAWSGGTPTIAGFDVNFKLGFFSGTPLEAIAQTVDNQMVPGRRTYVRGFTPLTDAATISGRVATKEWAGGTSTWKGSETVNTRTGKIPARADGRFHRFEVTIPAGATWSVLHGVEPDGQPAGQQ